MKKSNKGNPEGSNLDHASNISTTLNKIVGADTSVRKKRKTPIDKEKEFFENIMCNLDRANVRAELLGSDLNMNMEEYDETFYQIIDPLLDKVYGSEIKDLIFFFLYGKESPQGTINEITDDQGNIHPFTSIADLWNIIKVIKARNNASS